MSLKAETKGVMEDVWLGWLFR